MTQEANRARVHIVGRSWRVCRTVVRLPRKCVSVCSGAERGTGVRWNEAEHAYPKPLIECFLRPIQADRRFQARGHSACDRVVASTVAETTLGIPSSGIRSPGQMLAARVAGEPHTTHRCGL